MEKLAYSEMNLFGMTIFFVFLLNQRRSGSDSLDDRLFNYILIFGIVLQALDMAMWLLDGVLYPGSQGLLLLITTVSYLLSLGVTLLWILYCDLRVYMNERRLKKRLPLYLLPLVVGTLMLLFNLSSPILFTIGPDCVYHRGPQFVLFTVILYTNLLWSLLVVIRRALYTENPLDRREFRYMAMFSLPPIIGGLIQAAFYGVSIVWMGMVVSVVVVYVNVLNRQISTDALTGLNNRRKLNRYMDLRINSADADVSMYLVMIDVDDFKGINDTYGHAVGDRALTRIADILRTLCQNRDCFLARLGGDEFVILGRDGGDEELAALVADIGTRVAAFNRSGAEPYQLSLSIGTARFHPQGTNTADALFRAADQSMYRIKSGKKARIQCEARSDSPVGASRGQG